MSLLSGVCLNLKLHHKTILLHHLQILLFFSVWPLSWVSCQPCRAPKSPQLPSSQNRHKVRTEGAEVSYFQATFFFSCFPWNSSVETSLLLLRYFSVFSFIQKFNCNRLTTDLEKLIFFKFCLTSWIWKFMNFA